ncbi:MAG: hypothetical protein ACI4LQ_01075 [Anaerovoracaceae bacterium]
MAPCCNNIVTPKMIRTGQVRIGDRIRLDAPQAEEESKVVSAPAPEAVQASSPEVMKTDASETAPVSAFVSEPASEPVSGPESDSVPVQARITPMQQQMQMPQQMQSQMNMPGVQQMGSQGMQPQSQQQTRRMDPISFSEMTPYLSEVQAQNIGNQANDTSISLPQSPMTGLDFTQTIDVTDVQAFTGFLSTQIGRYMRVEQLIGSNIVEDRFGFLVGIGTNFIILQEITTGNIMVLDLFTIRMTYIYYSQPIFPESLTV